MPMKENIFIVCFDYQEIEPSDRHLTIKGQKVEAHYPLTGGAVTHNTKLLKSGLITSIPNSHLQSMLETLQLYQFIMVEQEVSLPILQKIKDDTCTDDEKCFLFLDCIDDDPILLDALRYDKRQYEEGELYN